MQLQFSFIIPVYNRPEETEELLQSFEALETNLAFEIVIVEDGSTVSSEAIVNTYKQKLDISYYFKENSGPGDSRNFGMKKAKGNYFIILDSDCILPKNYLTAVEKSLNNDYVDCFGGPDAAHESFSNLQKAINFSMTSFITTGGIRGNTNSVNTFQPRSFNMGISKNAFLASGGFGNIHPGEDPDLSIRLWNLGFETKLFQNAYVYHKRRIDWEKFTIQVNKFGKVRPILNSWYPKYNKLTFFFPSVFIIGFGLAVLLLVFTYDVLLKLYFIYFLILFIVSAYQNKSLKIGYLSIVAVWKQFYGYGTGFIESYIKVIVLKQKPEIAFPELFFKV